MSSWIDDPYDWVGDRIDEAMDYIDEHIPDIHIDLDLHIGVDLEWDN